MPLSLNEVMTELERLGSEQTRKTWRNHGSPEPIFGVKVGDLKLILKRTKKDHDLALQLWDTGNSDAQYLAGLMADEKKIDEATLERWAQSASWYMLAEYSVPWVTAEAGYGWRCGLRWIEDTKEMVACAGWSSLGGHASGTPDAQLDLPAIDALLDRVAASIHQERNRVRYAMNNFVIQVACYVAPCAEHAKAVARAIGPVSVDMGGTACKVPYAPEYIEKVLARGPVKKRKTHRC